MAGLDGIKNKIEPHEPVDKDLYELPPEEAKGIPQLPGSLDEALKALEADHDFLLEGGVFTQDLIDTWIEYKREKELLPLRAASAPLRVRAVLRGLTRTPCDPEGPASLRRCGPFRVIGSSRRCTRDPEALALCAATGSARRRLAPRLHAVEAALEHRAGRRVTCR